jgi:ribonuclease D
MDYKYIDTPEGLNAILRQLQREPLIAVDTEAAGYHRYLDRLSLVQISSRTENFLIDPLALPDLSALAPLFTDRGVEKLFHDADFDLRILDRDQGLSIEGLFDTQIAGAFLGERSLGLGSMLETYLDIRVPKAYQRADWAERPLSEGMKDYAATDTAYLPALRDRLREGLKKRGRLHWAEEEFVRREATRWTEPGDGREPYLRVKGARDLPPRGLAVLRELFEWREEVGRERDQATFRVLSNQALIAMSVHPPETLQALGSVSGVSEALVQRRGQDILDAIRRGMEVPESELPKYPRSPRFERDPEVEDRANRLRRVRTETAEALELDPGFLMARAMLEEIARRNPSSLDELAEIPEVRRWQVEALGEPLLGALRAR